jgi:hypothetical protein
MSAATGTEPDLDETERAVLEALDAADPTGSRRADLAEDVDVDYPEAELVLKQRGLIEEAGVDRVRSDEGTIKHRLVALTQRGQTTLADARAPDPEPEPVEPEVVPRRRPWYETTAWDEHPPAVDRLLEEIVAVEHDEAADIVRITLDRDGERKEIELSLVAWHNNARTAFYDEYRSAFGETPDVDARGMGVLQARLMDNFAETDSEEE